MLSLNRIFSLNWLTLLALFFYLFTAYKSSGYNNADEHYQIIEFANYKLGFAQKEDLAWEFHDQIRSSLQPVVCFMIFKAAGYLGANDPHTLAFILRVITAVLLIVIIRYFILSSQRFIEQKNLFGYFILSFFIWYLPYINVRFSSETWSGAFILLSIAIVIKRKHIPTMLYAITVGCVLGLAILFRYQSAIIAGSLIIWLFFNGTKIKHVATVISSISIVLLIGALFDRWFYGEFCFTLYNYFYVNIVKDVASQYGVSPWYGIILYVIKSPGPFGILIFISYIAVAVKQPKHILIWVSLHYLIIHSIIPHKELRFLFPLANLTPLVMILGYQSLKPTIIVKQKVAQLTVIVLIFLNIAGLLALNFRGAGLARISVSQFIAQNYAGKNIQIIYVGDSNPYWDWAIPKNTFYYNKNVSAKEVASIWKDDLKNWMIKGKTNLLILSPDDITGPRAEQMLKDSGLKKVFQSIPDYALFINRFYNEDINRSSLLIYEFNR
ncbi:hypothetical protein [Mucilaginibacter defluvii]